MPANIVMTTNQPILVHVVCEKCNYEYRYLTTVESSGQARADSSRIGYAVGDANTRAAKAAAHALSDLRDPNKVGRLDLKTPHKCPSCDWEQSWMLKPRLNLRRARWGCLGFVLGLAALIALALLLDGLLGEQGKALPLYSEYLRMAVPIVFLVVGRLLAGAATSKQRSEAKGYAPKAPRVEWAGVASTEGAVRQDI